MSKLLNKYVTILYAVDKTLLLFTTAISTPVGIANASISLVFLVTNEIIKMSSKRVEKTKIKTKKLLYWKGVN